MDETTPKQVETDIPETEPTGPKMTIESLLACSKCGYEPVNPADLRQHWFYEHTD